MYDLRSVTNGEMVDLPMILLILYVQSRVN